MVPGHVLDKAGEAIIRKDIDGFLVIFNTDIYPPFMEDYKAHMMKKGIFPSASKQKVILVQQAVRVLFALESLLVLTHRMTYVELLHSVVKRHIGKGGIRRAVDTSNVISTITIGQSNNLLFKMFKGFLRNILGKHFDQHIDMDMLFYMLSNVGDAVKTYSSALLKNGSLTQRHISQLNPPFYVLLALALMAVDERYIQLALDWIKKLIDKHVLGVQNDADEKQQKTVRMQQSPNARPVSRLRQTSQTKKTRNGTKRSSGLKSFPINVHNKTT